MASSVKLSNRTFQIGFSDDDNTRRNLFFREGSESSQLTDQEQELLDAIGIDEIMAESLKPYLADFFKSLQKCNNDTSLVLNTDCELPYFILWSVLFYNQKETETRLALDQAQHKPITDLGDAMLDELLSELSTSSAGSAASDPFQTIFTLMVSDSAAKQTRGDPFQTIFTLLV